MTELARAFAVAQSQNRAVLVGYLPVGFPSPRAFAALVRAASELDVLELGFPCAHPSMDGPVIRNAMEAVLRAGIDLEAAFRLVAELRPEIRIPTVAMAYWQAVDHYGVQRFLKACGDLRLSGVLVPDLPRDRLLDICREVRAHGLELVGFLDEPSDAAVFTGLPECRPAFLYLRSAGMTGEAVDIERAAAGLTELRGLLDGVATPVAVGFGVQTPEDVAALSALGADAVVVGTVLVRAAWRGAAAFRRTVKTLARATHRGR